MTVIAVTATKEGATAAQLHSLAAILYGREGWFLHGDCVGGDAQAHEIAQQVSPLKIAIFPPENPKLRAFCKGAVFTYKPLPYLQRDDIMVDRAMWLLGMPKGMKEELRSGTWHTIRYARKLKRIRTIIWPDGTADWDACVSDFSRLSLVGTT